MNILKNIILLTSFCSTTFSYGQSSNIEVVFKINYGDSLLKLQEYYPYGKKDSLQITSIKFYLSAFELLQNEKSVWREEGKFRLIDLDEQKSTHFKLIVSKPTEYNAIQFNLGIDSLTNVSGALGGDLDPTKGMYWTWQSGYINFKLEGNSNVCNTRHNEFVFHLGGYQSPYLGMQSIKLKVTNQKKINLILNIKDVLDSIDIVNQNHIMSPGKEAVIVSEKTAKAIKVN